ncbi:hypothetical protein, partial [Athalassotoga sp.]|uniref:hypothetical protein n=1 Tax=Athalassotoga sp. TaxID=2022597 RepID=UPI003D077477
RSIWRIAMLSLNGQWEFYSSKVRKIQDELFKENIQIPSCVEEFFEDHKKYMLFRKEFTIDPCPKKDIFCALKL